MQAELSQAKIKMANWPTCLVAEFQAAPKAAKTFFSALEPWRCSILTLSSGRKVSSLCIALSRTHKLEDKTKTKSNRSTVKKTMNMNTLAGRSTKANAHVPSPSNTTGESNSADFNCSNTHNNVPNFPAGRSIEANAHVPSPSNAGESTHNDVPNFSCFASACRCQT